MVLFRTGRNSVWKDSIDLRGENQVFDALVASCLLQLGVVGKLNLPTTPRKAVAMAVSAVA